MRTYCTAQKTLLNALQRPKQDRNPKKRGYTFMKDRFTLPYSRKQHNIIKQLNASKLFFFSKKPKVGVEQGQRGKGQCDAVMRTLAFIQTWEVIDILHDVMLRILA